MKKEQVRTHLQIKGFHLKKYICINPYSRKLRTESFKYIDHAQLA